MRRSNRFSKLVLYLFMGLVLQVCAAYPDPAAPGSCQLSCGNAKMPANNIRIRFLNTTDPAPACNGANYNANYAGSIPVFFVIEQTAPNTLPASTVPGDATPATPLQADVGVPMSGISFSPNIVGGAMGPDNPDDPSARFKGVVTSQSEWCTDSCGVGFFELVPVCLSGGNNVNVQVQSGANGANLIFTLGP